MEDTAQTGGSLYDEGGYGCVFTPPLLCANEKGVGAGAGAGAGAGPKQVDKLLKASDAEYEYSIAQSIQKIPLWRQYLSVPESICTPAPISKQTETELGECKLIGSTPLGKMRLLRSSFVGVPIQQLKLNIATFSFYDFAVHLLEGVSLLNLFGIVHRDLHMGNILVDRANVPRIIDFNLAVSIHNMPAAAAKMRVTYDPELMQVSPDWALVNAVAAGRNAQTIMEDLFHRNSFYKTVQTLTGITEREQRDALQTFYEKSRSLQAGNVEAWFQNYWRLVDAWAVGMALTYVLSKLLLWPSFQRTDYRAHKDTLLSVIRGLTAFNPLERIDSIQALAMLNPDSYVLRKYGMVWLEKVGRRN